MIVEDVIQCLESLGILILKSKNERFFQRNNSRTRKNLPRLGFEPGLLLYISGTLTDYAIEASASEYHKKYASYKKNKIFN